MENVSLMLVGVGCIVGVAELLYRWLAFDSEYSRKFVHIGLNTFAATWVYFASYNQIALVATVMVLVAMVSKKLHIFTGVHAVPRKTWGEVFNPLAILFLALVQPATAIYATALLIMAWADGLAAIVGKKLPVETYRILGATKSFGGTATFIFVAMLITAAYAGANQVAWMIWLMPFVLAAVENAGSWGADDLTIVVVATGYLQVVT